VEGEAIAEGCKDGQCDKCGKTIKSKSKPIKCNKHSKDDGISKAEAKDNKNRKKDDDGRKKKSGKGSFTWTHELDKKLLEMMDADVKWPKIQSTLCTNKANCLERLDFLRNKTKKEEDVKLSNEITEEAWDNAIPLTNTNHGFGTPFEDIGTLCGVFGSDFGGDTQNKDTENSWNMPNPAAGDWRKAIVIDDDTPDNSAGSKSTSNTNPALSDWNADNIWKDNKAFIPGEKTSASTDGVRVSPTATGEGGCWDYNFSAGTS
jgi:hypothetical protein